MDIEDELSEYKYSIEFRSYHRLHSFLQDFRNWCAYKERENERLAIQRDRRGTKTRQCHERARAYQQRFPSIPYKICYREANSNVGDTVSSTTAQESSI